MPELAAAEHRQRPFRVVDRVHPPGVRVPPEPLDRRPALQRPAAGVLEQQVHRADRLPGAGHLVAPHPQPQRQRQLLARARVRHQLGHVPLERQPRGVEQARRLGDPHLAERVLGRLLPHVRGPHPVALVGHVRVVGPGRHADDRRRDGVGEDRSVRDAVQRPGVALLARAGAPGDVGEAQRPVRGDERAVHHDVVAAGAAQADRVPHVVDGVVAGGQQERAEVDRLAVAVDHDPAEQHPARVVAAGGEAPPPVQPVAALDRARPPGRRVRGGHPRGRVGAPDVLLRLRREQGELPRMHAEDRRDPAGRPAGARDQPHRGEERDRVGLKPAVAGRLEQPEEAGLRQRLDRLGRHDPVVLGLLGPLPEHREQVGDRGDNRRLRPRVCAAFAHKLSLPRARPSPQD